jgi:hypothetical protein
MSCWVIGIWSSFSRKTCVSYTRQLVLVVIHLSVARSVNTLIWCCKTVSSACESYWILVATHVGCGSYAICVHTAIRLRYGIDSSSVTCRIDAAIRVGCRVDVVRQRTFARH